MTIQSQFDIHDQRIDLVRFPEGRAEPTTGVPTVPQSNLPWTRRSVFLRVTLLSLPTIIAAFYFFVLAASRYDSISTFVVRSPGTTAVSELANLVQGTGVVSSADDAYIVHEYIQSRDAMHDLIAHDGLLGVMERSGWDPVWAPAGTFLRKNDERLYRHYQSFVSVSFDTTTGISNLHVQAFEPHDAQRISAALLQKSEELLNRLNKRAQNDAIASALKQVEASKERAEDAQSKITVFRNRESVIDPTLQSDVVLQTVAGLAVEVAETNAQLAGLLKSSPQSPQISTLRLRITALQDQIAKERAQFGGNAASLAPRIAEYEALGLQRKFAELALASSFTTLESAKVDAQRRRTYLEQIARPSLPDYSRYPYRLIWVLAVGAGNFALYWILRHLLRDTLAHARD